MTVKQWWHSLTREQRMAEASRWPPELLESVRREYEWKRDFEGMPHVLAERIAMDKAAFGYYRDVPDWGANESA
jgi:hypothetical protein